MTDDEARALAAHLRHALEYDPFPYAPRLDPLKAILAKLEPSKPIPRTFAADQGWHDAAPSGQALTMKYSGPPMILGNAAAAHVRLIVWYLDCRHQVEPDPAEMVERYGAEMAVPDWHARLVCSECGSRRADMVVTGTERG